MGDNNTNPASDNIKHIKNIDPNINLNINSNIVCIIIIYNKTN